MDLESELVKSSLHPKDMKSNITTGRTKNIFFILSKFGLLSIFATEDTEFFNV